MSITSEAVLRVSLILTLGAVAGVHNKQNWDRERLRDGVIKDVESLERKKENLLQLEELNSLSKELKAESESPAPETQGS